MKYILLLLWGSASITCHSQIANKTIDIRLGNFKCRFKDDLKPSAESAYKLMSLVYSSPEFQDSIRKLTFPDNSCNSCGVSSSLTGDQILVILFSKTIDTLGLKIKKRAGALGETSPQSTYTTAYYKNIIGDMCNLPFPVGLAVNLCHEYMHHICFCHPRNPKDVYYRKPSNGDKCEDENFDPVSYTNDVAYRVGWIAYDILLRWYKEGKLQRLY